MEDLCGPTANSSPEVEQSRPEGVMATLMAAAELEEESRLITSLVVSIATKQMHVVDKQVLEVAWNREDQA